MSIIFKRDSLYMLSSAAGSLPWALVHQYIDSLSWMLFNLSFSSRNFTYSDFMTFFTSRNLIRSDFVCTKSKGQSDLFFLLYFANGQKYCVELFLTIIFFCWKQFTSMTIVYGHYWESFNLGIFFDEYNIKRTRQFI